MQSPVQPQRVVEPREPVAARGLDAVSVAGAQLQAASLLSAARAGYQGREAHRVSAALPLGAQAPPINSWEDTTLTFLASTLTVIIVAIVFRRLLVMSGTNVWAML